MKESFNNYRKRIRLAAPAAFTLLELLVVVMLIITVGTVGFIGLSNLTQIQGRKGAISSVISAIRMAQTYAISNGGNGRIVFATNDPAFSGSLEEYKNTAFILMYFGYELDSNGKPKLDSTNKPLPPKWQPLSSWTKLPSGMAFHVDQTQIFNTSYRTTMSLPRLTTPASVAYIEFDELGGIVAPQIGDIDIFVRDVRNTTPIISEQIRINQFTGSVIYLSKDNIEVIDRP